MSEQVPQLEAEIAQLLEAEKAIAPASREEKARALGAVLARVRVTAGSGGGHSNGGGAGGLSAWARSHPRLSAAVVFTLGAGSGAALHASLAREHLVYVTQAAPPLASDSSSRAETAELPGTLPPPRSSQWPTTEPRRAQAGTILGSRSSSPLGPSGGAISGGAGDTLAAERAIVDVARRAVGSGDGASAMQAVELHERKFPGGLLEEEREAMGVKALALLGRAGEARSRAARFLAKYPRSLLAPAVERAAASTPADAGASEEGPL